MRGGQGGVGWVIGIGDRGGGGFVCEEWLAVGVELMVLLDVG